MLKREEVEIRSRHTGCRDLDHLAGDGIEGGPELDVRLHDDDSLAGWLDSQATKERQIIRLRPALADDDFGGTLVPTGRTDHRGTAKVDLQSTADRATSAKTAVGDALNAPLDLDWIPVPPVHLSAEFDPNMLPDSRLSDLLNRFWIGDQRKCGVPGTQIEQCPEEAGPIAGCARSWAITEIGEHNRPA